MVPVGPFQFQEVRSFRYLGTTISNTLDRAGQVHRRIAAATRSAHFLGGFVRTNPMPRPFVVRLYIILRPGILFDLNTASLIQLSRSHNISIRALLRNCTVSPCLTSSRRV